MSKPAIEGGAPVRSDYLPVSRPSLGDAEINEVVDTLRSGWLTTGPRTETFEIAFADYAGNRYASAVSSGTAALGLALEVAGVGAGTEVITTPMTWVATAHQVCQRGARPVFVDIDRRTYNINVELIESAITDATKAILPVHFAGRPCDMNAIRDIADRHDLIVISDSAHAIETIYQGEKLATLADLSAYSFHPMKSITTGEGGMVTTDRLEWQEKVNMLRFHGVNKSTAQRHKQTDAGTWDVVCLGDKLIMSDIQAAMGVHQVESVEKRHEQRAELFEVYNEAFANVEGVIVPAPVDDGDRHACHMYNILLDTDRLSIGRDDFCAALKAENIGAAIHYVSLHKTFYYRQKYGYSADVYPESNYVSDRILTLPLWAGMNADDCLSVAEGVRKIFGWYGKVG